MDAVRGHLERLVEVLKPQMEFLNCHMVDYLVKDHWKTHIPANVRKELNGMSDLLEAKEVFWNQFDVKYENAGKYPSLVEHIEKMKAYKLDRLTDVTMSVDQLRTAFDSSLKETRLQMPELMSVKKRHEVEIASAVVASLCTVLAAKNSDNDLDQVAVIDAGDGKGYLSSRVALEHGIKVLGIDSNEGHTVSAEKRRDKLKNKVRKAVKKSELANEEYFNDLLEIGPSVEPNYKTTTKLIDFDTNLIEMVKEQFPDSNATQFCLAGLHTCGNLGPNCLRLFHQNPHIKALCNVGCCYHLLIEEFVVDPFYNRDKVKDNPGVGFPMSEFLRAKGFYLGRNARNLAAESIERSAFNRENPNDKLGYRAMLEIVLLQLEADVSKQVGKLKCSDFVDYARKALRRLDVDGSGISEEFLKDLESKFHVELEQLKVFYLYRMTYAPILEGVILLDRLLFLKESGYENSFLVKLFDPVVSPRCYSILAFK
ncbi:methyltransferase-like protein 25 [Aedes aegypti]|uniref:Methyltransferase domain-containing protein n=1 Tax=Aedes aegypti TaxID=7159 RepID=A0A6I8U665_AEDAE|nr:methyltransferase-like protein 25 [Aedes aegypti]